MLNVSESVFRNILKKNFISLVGISCKRLEVLSKRMDITPYQQIDIAKDLIKELNYEAMREIIADVMKYSKRTRINVNLTKPDSSIKEE